MHDDLVAGIDAFQRCALLGGLLLVLVLEAVRPYRPFPSEGERFRHGAANFGLWLSGFVLIDLLVNPRLRGLLPADGASTWTDTTGVPLWLQAILGLLILDLTAWGVHWLEHRVRWLWLLHAVHHSDPNLDVTSGLRVHPVEGVVGALAQYILLLATGLPLWTALLNMALVVPVTLWQHANLSSPSTSDRMLRTVLASPALHRLHHSPDPSETDSNYGIMFSFWDRLFGTFRPPDPERPVRFGLRALVDPQWQGLVGMLLTPLTARRKLTL